MNTIQTAIASNTSFGSVESILSITAAAIYTTDACGRITYFNDRARAMWGIEPELGVTVWCGSWKIYRTTGEELPLDQCPMAICLKENRAIENGEIVVERPDGSRREVIVNPRPIRDANDQLIGAINTMLDVSAMRAAERSRDKSDHFAQQILDNSQDCIKVLDAEGRLRSINRCGIRSLEIASEGDALGLSYFDFWSNEDRTLALKAAEQARQSGSGRFTASYMSSSGKVTIWDEVVSALRDPGNDTYGYVVISRDLTEVHLASQRISRHLAQQKALAAIGLIALNKENFDEALQQIIEVAGAAVDCELAKILQFADNADHLLLRAGTGWKAGLVGHATVGTDTQSQAGYTLSVNEPVIVTDLASETRFSGPELLLSHNVRSGMSVPIPGSASRPFGVLGVHSASTRRFEPADVDFLLSVAHVVASRWRHEEALERRALLLREMAHRSGNLLQLANSVFLQTLRFTPDIEEAKRKFAERLSAMARANMLVSSGGRTRTNLKHLAEEMFEPFQARTQISGRDIILPDDVCFDIGLIWHELSTNSAKYGAFSNHDGIVAISWNSTTADDGSSLLILDWQDSSPAVAEREFGKGFGTKLLTELAERKLGGRVEVENFPHYHCRISINVPARGGSSR